MDKDLDLDLEDHDSGREQLLHPGKQSNLMVSWVRARRRNLRRLLRRPLYLALFGAKFILLPLLLLIIIVSILAPSYTHYPVAYQQMRQNCKELKNARGCANPNNEKVFITSILYDKGGKLAGGKWGKRVLELIDLLGPDNVFLSIYESDSGKEGQLALERFKRKVPCRQSIVNEEHVTWAGIPNVTLPDGNTRVKRVAFLAELRNRALRPLDTFDSEKGMVQYDKILFLNDISFHPMDAAHLLLNTNAGADGRSKYLAACAMDFQHPFQLYDSYAMRDAEGFAHYQYIYPFFRNEGKAISRGDVFAQKDAVEVKACWGGMMAVEAKYVQNLNQSMPTPDFQSLATHIVRPDAPRKITAPVRFRYEPEVFYDACECCLFPADVAQAARREGAAETGVYMNPFVRVAYSEIILAWLPIAKHFERLVAIIFTFNSMFVSSDYQPYRTVREGDTFMEEVYNGTSWELVERKGRSGMFCGIRDMQVLRKTPRYHGRNWYDTRQPPGHILGFRVWWGDILPTTWRDEYNASTPEEKDAFFEFDRWTMARHSSS